MYLYKRGLLPDSFNDMLLFNCDVHSYNTRSQNSFRLPHCRTNVRNFSRRIQKPKIFNFLSCEIQNAPSTAVFISKLNLFSLAFIFFTFCIICSLFFFLSFFPFFFCALALLVVSIFIPFSDYFLCYKQIVYVQLNCLSNASAVCFLFQAYIFESWSFFIQGRTIRKVMGEVGGISSRRNFFSLSNSIYELFF